MNLTTITNVPICHTAKLWATESIYGLLEIQA
jgi:hypothetical protein